MKRLVLCALVALCIVPDAFGWGQKGHDVVACIAECHLSRRAARRVTRALEGHSPVYYANWMDNASHTPEYAYSSTWHYANIDEGYTYETMPRNEAGDIVTALHDIIDDLRKGGLTPEEENIRLRMLVHLVGDLHCPMHAGHKSDLGGNTVSVLYFDTPTKLHTIWDTQLVESAHKWSYTEWQRQNGSHLRRDIQGAARGHETLLRSCGQVRPRNRGSIAQGRTSAGPHPELHISLGDCRSDRKKTGCLIRGAARSGYISALGSEQRFMNGRSFSASYSFRRISTARSL